MENESSDGWTASNSDSESCVPEPRPKKGQKRASEGNGKGKGKKPVENVIECSDSEASSFEVPEPRPKKGKKGASKGWKVKRISVSSQTHFQSSSSAAAEEPQVININLNNVTV